MIKIKTKPRPEVRVEALAREGHVANLINHSKQGDSQMSKKEKVITKSAMVTIEELIKSASTREDGAKLKNAGMTTGIILSKCGASGQVATYLLEKHCQEGGKLSTMKSTLEGLRLGKEPEVQKAESKASILARAVMLEAKLKAAGIEV